MTSANSIPTALAMHGIISIGPPPQRHADRVVAEMMQRLAQNRASIWAAICQAISNSSDGSPKAQRKMEERVRRAGAVNTRLTPGKRGRYELIVYDFTGWDYRRDTEIGVSDAIPPSPWIACHLTSVESQGNGREMVAARSAPMLFISHHAMSRVAQRLGMRTADHMLDAIYSVWNASIDFLNERGPSFDPPPCGWRAPLETHTVKASVVLQRHHKRNALVATTVIIDPPSEREQSPLRRVRDEIHLRRRRALGCRL